MPLIRKLMESGQGLEYMENKMENKKKSILLLAMRVLFVGSFFVNGITMLFAHKYAVTNDIIYHGIGALIDLMILSFINKGSNE